MAEYSFEVYNSAAYLEELLEKEGFTVERGIGGMKTAFVGTCGSGKPVIGILAEYDALPNMSQKAGETKPCPIEGKKYGHACGHSALAAGTVGAAIKEGAKAEGISEEEFAKRLLITRVEPVNDRVMERQYTASTDVGDVSYIVPTTQYSGTTSIPETGLHTWQFAAQVGTSIGDKGSIAVARAIERACAEVWENPEAVNTAKEELLEATGGVYVFPIPDGIKPGDGM